MLVLSRRKNEEIAIPDLGITIEVLQVNGSTVRLGIKAPRSIRVLRGELGALHSQWKDKEIELPQEIELPIGQVPTTCQLSEASS